jgi:signal transduction histidine kinase
MPRTITTIMASIKKELPDFIFSFENKTEKEFRNDYIDKSLVVMRGGYLLCIFLYAIFGLLDIWIVPETKHIAWFIRFAIVIPLLIGIIISTFFNFFKRHNQILLIISSAIVGIGIIIMIAWSKPEELGHKYYYSGLILVLIWIYTFIRIRFWNSMISGLIITFGYELVAIFVQHLTEGGMGSENMLVFINNNFFFLSANILGLFASYHNEKLHRSDFLQKQIIKDENIRILNISNLLYQVNEEVTVQRKEIEAQRDRLSEQNHQLEMQQESILLQNKELQEINATKDKFFSIIAHDLKNPFNNILASSNLLATCFDTMDPNHIIKSVAAINNSANSAYKLLENLLEWSRAQTGLIEFNQERTILKNNIDLACEITESIASNKNLSLDLDISQSIEVFADRNMLNTVLRNLITNALKYTNKGGVIKIRAYSQDNNIIVSVIDNGVGIDPAIMDNLFNISQKVSTTGTERETGTGLGLLLCKEFVEKHGGEIWVDSELGKGSEFKFTLPKYNDPQPRQRMENNR